MSISKKGKNAPMYGKHHTEESIQKIKEANIGRKHKPRTNEWRIKQGKRMLGNNYGKYCKGKIVSKETCEKISKAKIGTKHTKEQNQKQSLRMSGSGNPIFGTHRSEETKKKLSEANMGKKQSDTQVNKKSKTYQIIEPSGTVKIITNLSKYCRENNLDSGHMGKVAKGEYKQHKGYKCEKIREL